MASPAVADLLGHALGSVRSHTGTLGRNEMDPPPVRTASMSQNDLVVFQICTFTGQYTMVIPPLRGDAHGTRSRDVPLLSQ
jgi:hypothetical protein